MHCTLCDGVNRHRRVSTLPPRHELPASCTLLRVPVPVLSSLLTALREMSTGCPPAHPHSAEWAEAASEGAPSFGAQTPLLLYLICDHWRCLTSRVLVIEKGCKGGYLLGALASRARFAGCSSLRAGGMLESFRAITHSFEQGQRRYVLSVSVGLSPMMSPPTHCQEESGAAED